MRTTAGDSGVDVDGVVCEDWLRGEECVAVAALEELWLLALVCVSVAWCCGVSGRGRIVYVGFSRAGAGV